MNLEALALPRNNIQDLSPLEGLSRLTTLDLAENDITDLAPLAELLGLTELGLRGNMVSDLTPLAGLERLERLDLYETEVTSLEPLSGLTALSWLSLYENRVTDLAPLAGLKALRALDLRNNDVVDFDALAGLTALEELHIGVVRYVGEENFSPVMNSPPPGDVYRISVPVVEADLSSLATLTSLRWLTIASLGVGDGEFLAPLRQLEQLEVRNARLTPRALEVAAGLPSLNGLSVSNNWLTDLGPLLERATPLEGLVAYWNCLDLTVDADGRVLNAFSQAVEPGGILLLLPQRPAEQCLDEQRAP